jgi:peptidoglycan hydrolase-like protein with peptidoglycan-binding domain
MLVSMSETSYNGWQASKDPRTIRVDRAFAPMGVPFPGGVVAGPVSDVLGYIASQIHLRVERLVPGWQWGYEWRRNLNDPSTLSCHASGTAIDVNSPNHANGAKGTWTPTQVKLIREILRAAGGVVAWGEDWTGTTDGMHFEISAGAPAVAAAATRLHLPAVPPTGLHPFPLPRGYYFGPLSGPVQSISGMAADGSDEQWRPAISRIQAVVRVRIDGLYGPITINAVKGWQAAHHLLADGLTGPKTWAAMRL